MKDISDLMIKVGELSVDEHINGKRIFLIDVSDVLSINQYNLALRLIGNTDLFKLHRSLILAEDYEAIAPIKAEIERRGYTITIHEKQISYANSNLTTQL